MKKLSLLFIATLFICAAEGQVRTLYVTGTVSSDEKMLVSVHGTKTIEGVVVIAELNGKKTEAKTDNNGQAILDFSSIAAGLANPTQAVIKSFDKNGNLLNTANTTVQAAGSRVVGPPVIEQLPNNLPSGEAVTIPGRNLGTDAKLVCGNKEQETLSASDREMTVFTNATPGEQPAYVTTANGVSDRQMVNIYSLDFALPKNSITPKENVQAMVRYESIPAGTKLIFTNKSQETIKMTIPGAENAANECIYTVSEKNGSLPVNITGLTRGNFTIALDFDFKDQPVKPKNEKTDDGNKPPVVFYDEKPQAPVQPPAPAPATLADTLKIKDDIIKGLDELSKFLNGEIVEGEDGKRKTATVLDELNNSITNEKSIYAAEQGILSDRRFSNLERNDKGGNLKKARENIEKALAEEKTALENKAKAANKLKEIKDKIRPDDLKGKITRAKNDEINADKLKNGTKAEKEKAAIAKSDAEANEKEVRAQLEKITGLLNEISTMIKAADAAGKKAVGLKDEAQKNIDDYKNDDNTSKPNKDKASEWNEKLKKSRDDLDKEGESLKYLSGEIDKMKKLNEDAKKNLDKITKK